MDENRLRSLLGLCRKAKCARFGHDAAIASIRFGKAQLCLLSADASERLETEFVRAAETFAKETPIAVIRLPMGMKEIGAATGLVSAVLTIDESGFAANIRKLLETNANPTETTMEENT